MKTTNVNKSQKGTLSSPNIAVFTAGSYTPGLKMYDDLANASFTTVVLWSTKVHLNGDFHMNNFGLPDVLAANGQFNPGLNTNFSDWQSKVIALKEPHTSITRVELSIGSGAISPQSFLNIKAIYDEMNTNPAPAKNLIENLRVLKEKLNLDAICFDDEAAYDLASSLWLAQQCHNLGLMVSISPFGNQSYWSQLVASANQTKKLIDAVYLQAWMTDGANGWSLNGVNPVAGMWLQSNGLPLMTPDQVTGQLLAWQETTPHTFLAGGWFYNANEVFVNNPTQMKTYSDAIWAAFFAI